MLRIETDNGYPEAGYQLDIDGNLIPFRPEFNNKIAREVQLSLDDLLKLAEYSKPDSWTTRTGKGE